MKKGLLLLTVMLLSMNSCFSTEYYCPSGGGGFNRSTDVYNDTKNTCEWLNSDFFKRRDPNGYSDCLRDRQIAERKYKQGKCDPIVIKKHTVDGASCDVDVSLKYNKALGRECTSSNPNSLKILEKRLREIYK